MINSTLERSAGRWIMAVAAIAIGLAVAWTTPANVSADAHNDWISTTAAWDGADPYRPLRELGAERGVYTWNPNANPRPPGAHILSWPLTLTTPDGARHMINGLSVLAAAFIGWSLYGPLGTVGAVGVLLLRRADFGWGNLGPIVGALVVASMRYSIGWLLGLAAALRLWPLALAVSWVSRRDRRAVGALLWFSTLTAAGFLLPGVTWTGLWQAMSGTSRLFDGAPNNGSLVSAFIKLGFSSTSALVTTALILGTWWFRHRTDEAAILVGLLLPPIVWPAYYWAAAAQMTGAYGLAALVLLILPGGGWFTVGAGVLLVLRLEFARLRENRLASMESVGQPLGADGST